MFPEHNTRTQFRRLRLAADSFAVGPDGTHKEAS
jgi:hypothetical protein